MKRANAGGSCEWVIVSRLLTKVPFTGNRFRLNTHQLFSVLKIVMFSGVRAKTRKRRFEKFALWRPLKVALLAPVFTRYVWTEGESVKKRFV